MGNHLAKRQDALKVRLKNFDPKIRGHHKPGSLNRKKGYRSEKYKRV